MSTIKTILMHMDDSPASAVRLQVAAALAERFDAAASALYAVLPAFMQYALAYSAGAELAPMMQEFETQRRTQARALYERSAGTGTGSAVAGGSPRVAWAETVGEPSALFARQALAADLLLLGQHDLGPGASAHEPASGVAADFVESVLLASGKPALIIPTIFRPEPIGKVVLVAWKATRESARAVSAALPFLQAAERVHLVSWDDPRGATDGGGNSGAEPDIELGLRRHGVNVMPHREVGSPREIGELMLSRAADLGADLLVMGCYGHGRAREWVLGGASRTVLQSMTLPVLMVH